MSQAAPIQQALNQTVNLVNTQGGSGTSNGALLNATTSILSAAGEKPAETKSDDKAETKPDSSQTKSAEKSETQVLKNDATKKLYCN